MLNLIENSKDKNNLQTLYKNLLLYLDNEKFFFEKLTSEEVNDIEKIF